MQAAGSCGSDVLDLWTLMQKDGQVGERSVILEITLCKMPLLLVK